MTDALPVTEESELLVAVMVTLPAAAGAVNRPLALMEPPLADHVTVVPAWAVALHCEVALGGTAEGLQATAMAALVVAPIDDLLLPPHAMKEAGRRQVRAVNRIRDLTISFFIPHRRRF